MRYSPPNSSYRKTTPAQASALSRLPSDFNSRPSRSRSSSSLGCLLSNIRAALWSEAPRIAWPGADIEDGRNAQLLQRHQRLLRRNQAVSQGYPDCSDIGLKEPRADQCRTQRGKKRLTKRIAGPRIRCLWRAVALLRHVHTQNGMGSSNGNGAFTSALVLVLAGASPFGDRGFFGRFAPINPSGWITDAPTPKPLRGPSGASQLRSLILPST